MAEINVEVVNNGGQTVGLRVEEGGEMHEYLKQLVRRDDLKSVTKMGARKTAAKSTAADADKK